MSIRSYGFFIATAILALGVMHPTYAAKTIAGVTFDDTVKVGAGETVLNGAGLRGVMMLNAYAVGLYLPSKQKVATDAYLADGPKRFRVVLLMEAPAERLAQSLIRGIEKNHDDEARAGLQVRMDALRAAVTSVGTAKVGDVADFDWLPDVDGMKSSAKTHKAEPVDKTSSSPEGGVLRFKLNGKQYGADIEGEDFYRAFMTIWLGERPTDRALKAELLGQGEDVPSLTKSVPQSAAMTSEPPVSITSP